MTSLKNLIIIRGPVGAGKTSVVEEIRKLIPHSSIIDFDAFKRQIDNTQSSEWRRQLALSTALFLCQRLMELGRTIIVDIHASHAEQLNSYIELAAKNDYKHTSFLLYPTLDICLQRAKERVVPDINYEIDSDMITKYWNEVIFINDEEVYSDARLSPSEIARSVTNSLLLYKV